MAESSGRVVIQATEDVFQAFTDDRSLGLEKLVQFANADTSINDECDVFYETLEIKGDVAHFEFNDGYWVETAKRLVATGKNLGLYLHAWDEYGAQYFLAQNPDGEYFSYFAGGPEDDFEVEGGDVVTEEKLQKWMAMIPESIRKKFPELLDIN